MKRDRLFVNGLMRLAACALMVSVGVGKAWGQISTSAPINPAFLQWQKERKQKAAQPNVQTNTATKGRRILSALGGDEELGFGLVPEIFDTSYLANLNTGMDQGVQDAMASSYDLRSKGVLTPVRNQSPHGTCWAHATCASLETGLLSEGKGTYDFSENNLANLHGFDGDRFHRVEEGGIGGNANISSAYLLRWGGPVLESLDPYPNFGGSIERTPARHVQNVRWVLPRTSYLDNDAIKTAIIAYGALHVSYYHSSSYYRPSTASYYFNGNTSRKTNHAVAIVGWNDNYSKSNFSQMPPGNGAFIVRNSWGSGWGDGGYFYVSYYDESFAWNTLYAFSNTEDTDNYDAVYQYDPLGLVTSVGYNSTVAWGANIFTATEASQLAAVGFYALIPNTSYIIYIYTGCSAGAPSSGTLAVTQSGRTDSAGFFTIPLTTKAMLSARQRFSVVLKLTTPGYNWPLAYEYAYPGYSSEATAETGQTFLSADGSNWTDFTRWKGSASFCCKAYTKSSTPTTPQLESIAITGVSSIQSGEFKQFTCEAKYSDGSKKTVAPTWSITEGKTYASISKTGLVTAKNVTALQKVKVKAVYKEGNITKDNEWGLYVTAAAPDAPTDVMATQGTDASCVRVTWKVSSGATEYAVYRATANNNVNAPYLGNVTVARYNDTEATPGVDYWYFVKAKNASDASNDFSAGAKGWRKLSPPDDVTATDNLTDKVTVTWGATKGAKYYRVCRTDDIDAATYPPISGWINAKSFDDTTAAVGKTYFYYVQAAVDANGTRPSDYSIVEDGKRAAPVSLDSLSISGAASIPSGSNETYTATAKYTDGNTKAVTPSSWSLDSTTWASVSSGKVTARTVAANQTVKLTAEYTENGKTITGTKSITITATQLSAPTGLKVTSQTTEGIVLTWNAMMGAASYNVYRGVGGVTAALIGTASSASFTDKEATPGVTYTYSVSAVNGAGESAMSGTAIGTVPLSVPTGVTATDNMMGEVKVSWLPVVGATHYRVARASSASGTKTELGGWITEVSFKDDTPSEEVTYYYFVRAATSSIGVNASDWSEYALGSCKKVKAPNELYIEGGADTGRSLGALEWTQYYCYTSGYLYGRDGYGQVIWSVTPAEAATIDNNGLLRANAVAADTTATITATWTSGSVTLTATRDIFISGVGTNTASVKDVRATSRWPFSNLVDVDYVLETFPPGTKARVTIYGVDTARDTMRAASIVAGDGQHDSSGRWISEMLSAGRHRTTCRLDWRGEFDIHVAAAPEEAVQSGVTVAFDANGGTSEFSSRNYQPGEPYRTLPRATRSEHSFVGWFTKNEGGERIAPTSIVPNTTSTLYARWADKMWKIDDYGELYGADFGDEKEVVFPEVSVISYVGGYCPAERMVIPESVTLIYGFGTSFPNLREVVILGAVGLPSGDDVLDYVDEGVLISWFPYGGADTGITIYVTEKWKGIMGDFLYGTVRPLADLSGKE